MILGCGLGVGLEQAEGDHGEVRTPPFHPWFKIPSGWHKAEGLSAPPLKKRVCSQVSARVCGQWMGQLASQVAEVLPSRSCRWGHQRWEVKSGGGGKTGLGKERLLLERVGGSLYGQKCSFGSISQCLSLK